MSGDNKSVVGQELAEKLDKQLDDYIAKLERKPYKDGFSEANWEQEMQQHPLFRTEPFNEGEELPPLMEALQQLKYDPVENSPENLALSYKEDGNNNFKLKKYRWAIDSYTEGIKVGCHNRELNCQLYANRAAAHYRLGNFRSSLSDCKSALQYKDDHMKAIIKGAQCCFQLGQHEDVMKWCSRGLKISPKEDTLLRIEKDAKQEKKIQQRNQRKEAAQRKRIKADDEKLLRAIQERGFHIAKPSNVDDSSEDILALASLEPCHPAASSSKVHLDDLGVLIWPVMFIYPEHAQTDYVLNFAESESFEKHLIIMFGASSERPSWDNTNIYIPGHLKIYFEEEDANTLWEVEPKCTLRKVLKHPRFIIVGGTPTFFITAHATDFNSDFVKRYDTLKMIE